MCPHKDEVALFMSYFSQGVSLSKDIVALFATPLPL